MQPTTGTTLPPPTPGTGRVEEQAWARWQRQWLVNFKAESIREPLARRRKSAIRG